MANIEQINKLNDSGLDACNENDLQAQDLTADAEETLDSENLETDEVLDLGTFNLAVGVGGESPKELFWCTYGVTKYADIKAAINSGKVVVVRYNDEYVGMSTMILTNTDSSRHYFSVCIKHRDNLAICYCQVAWNNVWSRGYDSAARKEDIPTKVSQLENDRGFITATYDAENNTLNIFGQAL